MTRSVLPLAAALLLSCSSSQAAAPPRSLPNGVYSVIRDSLTKNEVLPLQRGETLAINPRRYLKKEDQQPRFVVVGTAPDVSLDLDGAPKAIKKDDEVVGISLKLRPKAAQALERLTSDRVGRQVAIVIGGEVVTIHKVRETIKGGQVQITSCAPKAAAYLFDRLRAQQQGK